MPALIDPYRVAAPGFAPSDLSGLHVWLKADAITGKVNNDPVDAWSDSSGNARNAVNPNPTQYAPFYRTAQTPAGGPAVEWTTMAGADHRALAWGDIMSGVAAAEVFVYLRHIADPPSSGQGCLMRFGSAAAVSHIPFTDGVIYDAFGSTARKTAGNPAASMASWCTYNVRTQAGLWVDAINGTDFFSTASNTVGWSAAPRLGNHDGSNEFAGLIAEFILYSRVLTTTERADVQTYLNRHAA